MVRGRLSAACGVTGKACRADHDPPSYAASGMALPVNCARTSTTRNPSLRAMRWIERAASRLHPSLKPCGASNWLVAADAVALSWSVFTSTSPQTHGPSRAFGASESSRRRAGAASIVCGGSLPAIARTAPSLGSVIRVWRFRN